MACDFVRLGADNLLELLDALDETQDPAVEVTGATVTATVADVSDPAVAVDLLGTLALLEHPAAPSNDYRASFYADPALFRAGQRLRIEIVIDGGLGLRSQYVQVVSVREAA